jgi:TolA-binding protein
MALVSSAGAATWLAVRPAPSTEAPDVTPQSEARAAVSMEPTSEPRQPRQPPVIVGQGRPAVQAPRGIARHFAGSRDHAQAEPPNPTLAVAPPDAEAALVARALHELREEKNPRAALDTLDEHTRRFPRGRLLHEAAVARLEALTAMGEREQALAALEGGLPALAPLGRSALILRGELRASAGRLGGARDDFEAAWAFGGKDDLAARALLGLARVQLSLGARTLAEKNLHQYLDVFPHAAGAPAARKALGQP